MNLDSDTVQRAVGPEAVESASKVLLGTGALVFVLLLASLLPGLDRLLPETRVTLAAVIGALATLAVVGLLLYLASGLAALTRLALDGPAAIVEHVASAVHWLVVLAAVLVAHAGLAPAVTPLLDGARGTYDVAFLLLALAPLVIVAARLSVAVDPLAELVADSVAGDSERAEASESNRATGETASSADAPDWTPDGDRQSD
ncbi:hypothetical protein ACFQMA_12550 [Halosimplex aquaticum]|uniref:Uncharacterized protein n=1 Tax=Halosimplex aquaticum TaxID=3026162 RepID=A0ABD5Y8E7_9EURY|nr:hypothetical protein [Halosimplex aquaticum]